MANNRCSNCMNEKPTLSFQFPAGKSPCSQHMPGRVIKNRSIRKQDQQAESPQNNQSFDAVPPQKHPHKTWWILIAGLVLTLVLAVPIYQCGIASTVRFSENLVLKNTELEGKTEFAFGTDIKKSDVVSIEFLDTLENAPVNAKDVSETGNGKVLLWSEAVPDGLQKIFIAGEGKVYFPKCSRFLLYGDYSHNLSEIIFSDAVDTSHVTDMGMMFQGCSGLTSLDLSMFNTSKVTDMGWMFEGCIELTNLDLSNFDTSAVTDMESMFTSCCKLTNLSLDSFDTACVANMNGMFGLCSGLTSLDLSSFDTSQVKDMQSMFIGCSGLTSLDLSSFDTSQVTDMSGMFFGCNGLTSLELTGFNPSSVHASQMILMFLDTGDLTEENLHTDNQKIIEQFRKDKS